MEIIPVIHVINEEQVYKNIDTCLECGIKKVFLICHSYYSRSLIELAMEVKSKSGLWVGVNLLGDGAEELLLGNDLQSIDGLWADDGLTHLSKNKLIHINNNRTFKGMFFGGLAFKYQFQPSDLTVACENAKIITDVATTSGSATGSAPTKVKIENLRSCIGEHPMAIASGISVDNIQSYVGLAQYGLVASSITDKNELIIKDKLISLINKIK